MNKAKPLIVMSISTLLLYSQEFKENGFEHYFEDYYKSIEASKNKRSELVDLVNATVSFSEFMKMVYPKDFGQVYEQYKDKALPIKNSQNI